MSAIPERGYPLSALFVLMAACAVPMSMAAAAGRAVSEGRIGGDDVVFASLGGCAATMLLGAVIGLHHYRQGLGVILGALAGAIVGSMAGPIAMVPVNDVPYLLLMSLTGSAVMIALAAWFRRLAEKRREPAPPAWFVSEHPFAYAGAYAKREVLSAEIVELPPQAWPSHEPLRYEMSNLRGAGFGCLFALAAWTVIGIITALLIPVLLFYSPWNIRDAAAAIGVLSWLIAIPIGILGFLRGRKKRVYPWS
jgi:hypothetical protein